MMRKNPNFISLKWKLSCIFGLVFIGFFSVYSYQAYQKTMDNFAFSRLEVQESQINLAHGLSNESFAMLERFIESVLVMQTSVENNSFQDLFNQHWDDWQIIWGLKSAVFYDQKKISQQWGESQESLPIAPMTVQQVFSNEKPQYKIICTDSCYQQIFMPILLRSEVIGVLSVSISLSDILLNYKNISQSNIGIINGNTHKLLAVTQPDINKLLWGQVLKMTSLEALKQSVVSFKEGSKYYELYVFPAQRAEHVSFVIINNISLEYQQLQYQFYQLALLGLGSLVGLICILFFSIHFGLRRVVQLSSSLPLLVAHQYPLFKEKVRMKKNMRCFDEIDSLSQVAYSVAEQLEGLELQVSETTFELQTERDFVTQLINVAPIVILTQSEQGDILSINQAGLESLCLIESSIIGKPFDLLIPSTELGHLSQLQKLRQQQSREEIHFSCALNVPVGTNAVYMDWIHASVLPQQGETPIVLSLGVDITDNHWANDKLQWLAMHDALTGLANRYAFQEQLELSLAEASKSKNKVALFYLDLDQFKVINDTYGHQEGDKLLQLVADVLKNGIEETDILGRIGGDEFTLLRSNVDLDEVELLAQHLMHLLKTIDYCINSEPYQVSFSVGIAISPVGGLTQHDLLSNADLAMYYAKKTGRSRYHIYDENVDYQAALEKQMYWKSVIDQAIELDEFVLFYQPILDIKQRVISHYECLLRIEQADGTMLMPGDFIEYAEQLGSIDAIDRLVFTKMIERHLSFQAAGNNAKLAVNLSGYSMNNMQILPHLEKLLSLPGVKPELIIIEITETSAVSNFSSAQSLIQKIKALGCYFALDDFGVGFSSFYYLKSLPVDYVKIDGSFVKNMDSCEEDRIFVRVLTEVSQAFGKKIIAEFVENEAILELLSEKGVDYAQGYYVSKPLRDPLQLDHVASHLSRYAQ